MGNEAHTYDEWQLMGFQVLKGQKATGRNKKGVATFTEAQVSYMDEDDDYMSDMYMDIHFGD